MAIFATKSKWHSQHIQKKFKNKHSNGLYAGWNANYSNKNHFASLKKLCREYTKTDESQQYQHSDDLSLNDDVTWISTSYWSCSACTYDNMEGDSHCSICGSSSKPSSNASSGTKTTACTLSDYFPSELDDIVHHEDDLDESIQIALVSSCQISATATNTKYTYYADDDYEYEPAICNEAKPALYGYQNVKTASCKHPDSDDRLPTKKLWCTEKRIERKQRQQSRQSKTKKSIKNRKTKHPRFGRLRKFMRRTPIARIQDSIRCQYGQGVSFDVRSILNSDVLAKFCKRGGANAGGLRIVYHGTHSRNDQSIIDNGLIVGGTKGVRIRCGRAYGRGVYCSPLTSTASCYEDGSMFVCLVKYKKVNDFGHIWVVPNDGDILPLYLASFPSTSVAATSASNATAGGTQSTKSKGDGWNQQIIKFIPCFTLLNQREPSKRKIQRKWNAYFKIKRL
mmetsp:Transcript_9973/g.16022  ORF Transcript_9973/g.16022 Transcript_9973/m.16022 type:complete len:452 (+) Transcript_9973:130-1485(+)